MEKLNQKQSEWILKQLNQFINKYMPRFPLEDEEWEEVVKEATELEHKCKGNKHCRELIIATLHYMEELHKPSNGLVEDKKGEEHESKDEI